MQTIGSNLFFRHRSSVCIEVGLDYFFRGTIFKLLQPGIEQKKNRYITPVDSYAHFNACYCAKCWGAFLCVRVFDSFFDIYKKCYNGTSWLTKRFRWIVLPFSIVWLSFVVFLCIYANILSHPFLWYVCRIQSSSSSTISFFFGHFCTSRIIPVLSCWYQNKTAKKKIETKQLKFKTKYFLKYSLYLFRFYSAMDDSNVYILLWCCCIFGIIQKQKLIWAFDRSEIRKRNVP